MIARSLGDLIIAIVVALAAGGVFLLWGMLFAYALHYWGL